MGRQLIRNWIVTSGCEIGDQKSAQHQRHAGSDICPRHSKDGGFLQRRGAQLRVACCQDARKTKAVAQSAGTCGLLQELAEGWGRPVRPLRGRGVYLVRGPHVKLGSDCLSAPGRLRLQCQELACPQRPQRTSASGIYSTADHKSLHPATAFHAHDSPSLVDVGS